MTIEVTGKALQTAREAWGDDLPYWVEVLAMECDRMGSQSAVAREISYSPAAVNQTLKASYKGDLKSVEKAVRGAFLHDTVACPVLGDIEGHICLEHQRKPFANTNPIRVRMFKACRQCQHRRES